MQYFGLRVLLKRITAIRFLMKDKAISIWKKALIIAGIAYVIMPIDLIPIALLPVSWLDDVLLWLLILWYLRHELDKYWLGEKPKDFSAKYRGKNVVDDVEYEVREDGENGEPKDDD